MQEKVKTKIANDDASLMCGKNLINVWLTQQFDSGVHVYALVWLFGVDTLNILCDWNKLCDLLWMTSSVVVVKLSIDFFAKVTLSNAVLLQFSESCILQGIWKTTILRCGGLYSYCLFTKYFYIFAENLMKIRIQQLKLWRKMRGSFFPFTVYIHAQTKKLIW